MELRQAVIEIRGESLRLKARVLELEKKVAEHQESNGALDAECPVGWLRKSQDDPVFGELGVVRRNYRCRDCGFTEAKLIQ